VSHIKSYILGALFFLFYLGVSAWLPFYNIYLLDRGFSGSQVGIIAGVYQATLFFAVPVWGVLADRFGAKRVLLLLMLMAATLIFFLRLVSFYPLMILYMLLLASSQHPLGALLDSLAIGHLHQASSTTFGQLRVWGSLGWAVGTVLMGHYLVSHQTFVIFPIASVIYTVTWLVAWLYQKPGVKILSYPKISLRQLRYAFGDSRIVWLLILLVFYGIVVAPLYIFINLYYRDIGANNQLIGLAFAIQALSEVPFYFLATRLVRRFGPAKVLLTAMTAAMLRMLVYALIADPKIAVAIGAVQGLHFSLFWVAVVEIMHNLVPPQWRSTAQALLWSFHLGGGVTIGNITIGHLSDLFPMRLVMLMASVCTLLVLIGVIRYFRGKETAEVLMPR
jgi:PPP family 3-phenylpropionic acid transporter